MFSGICVPEGLGKELRETSYQTYTATKSVRPMIERVAVHIALSIFIGLKSVNKNCFICITSISSPDFSKIMTTEFSLLSAHLLLKY